MSTETLDPTYCPTCERNVCAIDTFTDDKTGWLCCTACTTALVDEAQSLADVACNCQATISGQGPWHPFGDTSLCPSEEMSPSQTEQEEP